MKVLTSGITVETRVVRLPFLVVFTLFVWEKLVTHASQDIRGSSRGNNHWIQNGGRDLPHDSAHCASHSLLLVLTHSHLVDVLHGSLETLRKQHTMVISELNITVSGNRESGANLADDHSSVGHALAEVSGVNEATMVTTTMASVTDARARGDHVIRDLSGDLDRLDDAVGQFQHGHGGAGHEGVGSTLQTSHQSAITAVLLHRHPEEVLHPLYCREGGHGVSGREKRREEGGAYPAGRGNATARLRPEWMAAGSC